MGRLLQVYEHEQLTVTFDTRRCIHAAECVRHLPAVFDPAARPWVRPERASSEEIISAVHRCPSGALRVARDGQPIEIETEALRVRPSRNGPLYLRGDVRIVMEDGSEIVQGTRVALCRCGASRRKPFCDGSHREAGFRAP